MTRDDALLIKVLLIPYDIDQSLCLKGVRSDSSSEERVLDTIPQYISSRGI